MKRRAWLLYLCLAGAALLAFELLPAFRQGWVFNLIGISSPVAIVIAVRMWNPVAKAPWYLFALGQTLFILGDIITYNYESFFSAALPFPSVGDVLYLSVYPCLVAGLLLLVRRRSPGRDREGLIDSLIVAIGVGVVLWVFVMGPTAADTGSTLLSKVVGMGYPFMDLILLTVIVRLVIGGGRRGASFYLLPTAAVALLLTDFVYSYISVQGIVYEPTTFFYLEAGWGGFYLLWGAAALHPSSRMLAEKAPEQEVRITRGRLVLIGGAALIPQAVRAIQLIRGEATDLWVITISTTCLFALVVVRMAGLVRKLELSFGREKALRTAGASLVTATNRDGIYAAAMQAVATLAPQGDTRVLVRDAAQGDIFTVVAASTATIHVGTSIDMSEAEIDSTVLNQQRAVQRPMPLLVDALGLSSDTTSVLAIPMFQRDELNALLIVGCSEKLPLSVSDGLEALSSQVALALESAALTEDLVRRQSEARFSSLVQHSSDVITVVEADSTIRYMSPAVERILGYASSDLEGTRLIERIHPDDKANVLQFLVDGGRDTDSRPALTEFRVRHRDDFWLHVETLRTNLLENENVRGIVLNTRDVSERKAFEEQLSHQAFHDSVTGLANRALFKDRVEHALERQTRADLPVSVLFMDLDDFKTINDSLGHAAGDRLLGEVGERVKSSLRTADTAARFGGDEFAVLLEDGGDGTTAAEVAARILASLEGPFHLEAKDVFVRASIGIASAEHTEKSGPEGAEELLRNADVAMYMAKEGGKGRYQVFEPAMHDTALKRLELKADLQRAVDNHEFVLHYQPVIELSTGAVEGFEALLRWMHPQRGMVPPLDFIPLAEETGLIVPIGKWVLREAAIRAKDLQDRYPADPPLSMAVNLSVRQLQRPEIVSEVAEILMETGLAAFDLVLEITESVMMQDMELSIQRLAELKELGVRLAVDDFGTGYSSLNYIRRFPVDILKVDKSFVDGVNDGGEESALTAAIIELASILKLRPVAEGIERADQLERLLDLKCDLGQGYYFAKPLALDDVDELLATRAALAAREPEITA
ncbi:MAG TPA: EAL domain-containing protein [Actinomycetota bacterium]|jgi:diguanylate cyclase (GGDEF)-like protein/PAS domain S-box-containing protein|nr:EAL domain-containing protein [Actinomycetota bacterium]